MKRYAIILLFCCALRGMEEPGPAFKKIKIEDKPKSPSREQVTESLRNMTDPEKFIDIIPNADYMPWHGREPLDNNKLVFIVRSGFRDKKKGFAQAALDALMGVVQYRQRYESRAIQPEDLYKVVALLEAGGNVGLPDTSGKDLDPFGLIIHSAINFKQPRLTLAYAQEVLDHAQRYMGKMFYERWLTKNIRDVDSVALGELFVEHGAEPSISSMDDYYNLCHVAEGPFAHDMIPWFLDQFPNKRIGRYDRQWGSDGMPLSNYIRNGSLEHADGVIKALVTRGDLSVLLRHGTAAAERVAAEMQALNGSPEEKIRRLTVLNNFQMALLKALRK